MKIKPAVCRGCPGINGKGFTEPVGKGKVLLIGDSPSSSDVLSGKAVSEYSARGATLNRALHMRKSDLDQYTYINMIQCQAPAERQVLDECAQRHLLQTIRRVNPTMIVALGDNVRKELTNVAGKKTSCDYTRGFVVAGHGPASGYPVKITYDPKDITEGNIHLLGALADDLENAKSQTRQIKNVRYSTNQAEWGDFYIRAKSFPHIPIAFDIETNYALKSDEDERRTQEDDELTQIQFSLGECEALILPWNARTKEWSDLTLGLPNPKLGFNSYNFDQRKLEKEGIQIKGRHIDIMWAWHFLEPDLPMNLSFVTGTFVGEQMEPWKHTMTEDLQRYGGCDVDALHRIWPLLQAKLEAEGIYGPYCKFIEDLQPILKAMSDRGLPIDPKRREVFKNYLHEEQHRLFREMQDAIPNSLKTGHPKEGYKKKPKVLAGKFEERDGELWAYDKEYDLWTKMETRSFINKEGLPEDRWVRVKPFLPNSPIQILRYVSAKKHALPKVRDGRGWKVGTGKKELLATGAKYNDPFYGKVVELRELGKMEGTYIDGWPLDDNNRVHSIFHYGPASGQLGSREPNIQNVPSLKKGGELARNFRACVRAEPGHVLVELDARAFHAKTLGYCAQDASYMQLADEDIHSYVASHLLHLPFADQLLDMSVEERKERLAWVKKNHTAVRDGKAKPAILGIGFGMGADKLYRMNEDSFENKDEARKIHSMLKGIFPKVFEWQRETRIQAHTFGKLVTPFGTLRRFVEVFKWNPHTGVWDPGVQGEECIAFPPANIAHCHMKEIMMEIRRRGLDDRYHMINMIHDALMFMPAKNLAEECIHTIQEIMEFKSTVLIDPVVAPEGFSVGAEASMGEDWATMKGV